MTISVQTSDPVEITENLTQEEFYRDSLPFLEEATRHILEILDAVRNAHIDRHGRDPIDHITHWIKSPRSMKQKLLLNNYPATIGNALTKVNDACGIRVVCRFAKDVFSIAEALERCAQIEVLEKKDYITMPKANGYRSYHLILKMPVQYASGQKSILVEVQIRSITMDCWASLEHQLKYKQQIPEQELYATELKHCADLMASMDLNLQTIRDLIDQEKKE